MKKIYYDKIKNEKGTPAEVVLNAREKAQADYFGRLLNALGFDIAITTLTTIAKKITEQKFYEVAAADFVPVRIGEGAWSDQILTYRDLNIFDDFSTGVVQTGDNNSRLASADAGVDSIRIPVNNWAKQIVYSIPQLEQASKSGNWDLVYAKERSRKKNWDLGIQKIAFLGLQGNNNASVSGQVLGLLNQNLSSQYGSLVTVDTTTLTNSISSLNPADLSTFMQTILNVYRNNNGSSAWPTHFVIPQSDYLGLATPTNSSFPLISKVELMQETFQTMTGNADFKILPSAYGDSVNNGTANQMYALYNYAEESIRMDIPVDFTNTLANTLNNYQFQSVAYGQFTGVGAYRPQELYYFQFPASNLS